METNDDQNNMMRIIREMAARNTIIDDSVLFQRFLQYHEVATWPMSQVIENLLTESKALLDPATLTQVAIVETPTVRVTFLNDTPQLINGMFRRNSTQFIVPFLYANGSFSPLVGSSVVEAERFDDGTWRSEPMPDLTYAVASSGVDRLLQNMTLLAHEAIRRQIREFEDFFAHAISPSDIQISRAAAEVKIWAEPTTRTLRTEEGESFTMEWSIASPGPERESVIMGLLTLANGQKSEFIVNELMVLGQQEDSLQIAMEHADIFVGYSDTVIEFLVPRLDDWNHARVVVEKDHVAKALRQKDGPVNHLYQSLVHEESFLAKSTETIRKNRLDLDGLKVEPRSSGGRL